VACRELTALLGQLQGQALGEAWRDHGLVFASSIGTPIEPRNVSRRWDELWRRAGLDWFRLHDLRHGWATLLLAKGVPDRVIMEVLGALRSASR